MKASFVLSVNYTIILNEKKVGLSCNLQNRPHFREVSVNVLRRKVTQNVQMSDISTIMCGSVIIT